VEALDPWPIAFALCADERDALSNCVERFSCTNKNAQPAKAFGAGRFELN